MGGRFTCCALLHLSSVDQPTCRATWSRSRHWKRMRSSTTKWSASRWQTSPRLRGSDSTTSQQSQTRSTSGFGRMAPDPTSPTGILYTMMSMAIALTRTLKMTMTRTMTVEIIRILRLLLNDGWWTLCESHLLWLYLGLFQPSVVLKVFKENDNESDKETAGNGNDIDTTGGWNTPQKRAFTHSLSHSKNAKISIYYLIHWQNTITTTLSTINHNHSTNDWSLTGTTDNQTHHHRNTALACIWTVRGCGTTSLAICQKPLSVNCKRLIKFVSKNWCCVHVFQTWNR